jgi:hypothetical protein
MGKDPEEFHSPQPLEPFRSILSRHRRCSRPRSCCIAVDIAFPYPTQETVISTEAAHAFVSSAAEKSASQPVRPTQSVPQPRPRTLPLPPHLPLQVSAVILNAVQVSAVILNAVKDPEEFHSPQQLEPSEPYFPPLSSSGASGSYQPHSGYHAYPRQERSPKTR